MPAEIQGLFVITKCLVKLTLNKIRLANPQQWADHYFAKIAPLCVLLRPLIKLSTLLLITKGAIDLGQVEQHKGFARAICDSLPNLKRLLVKLNCFCRLSANLIDAANQIQRAVDRKSTRLNSSNQINSDAVF